MTEKQTIEAMNTKREALGLSHQELADRAGLPRPNVSRILGRQARTGEKKPVGMTYTTVLKLAKALGMEVVVK
jgi:transcriptional regulator with XRE-family HTH domain